MFVSFSGTPNRAKLNADARRDINCDQNVSRPFWPSGLLVSKSLIPERDTKFSKTLTRSDDVLPDWHIFPVPLFEKKLSPFLFSHFAPFLAPGANGRELSL
jgi:hypothetical protein